MRAYTLDLREKIVESVKKGVPKSETARRFGVDRATVKRCYCNQLDERGTLEPRRRLQARETEARREGQEAALRRPPREALGYTLPEGTVPVCDVSGVRG